MDKDSNFSAAHGGGVSRPSFPVFATASDEEFFINWPALHEALQNLPDARPEAIERAMNLIADPDFPSPCAEHVLARKLAVLLTAEIESLPS